MYNSDPPEGQAKWGDFECHRTWFEITRHLNSTQWYSDTEYSNKTYWPLDYPPLCAQFHRLFGNLIQRSTPEFIDLGRLEN